MGKSENNEDDNIPPGMLSSPHIQYYVKKHKIIDPHEDKCFDSATYQMRLGGKVHTIDNGELKEFELEEKEDKNKNIKSSFELRPNSLTFITTIEKFNLPKDIIARFNLKSKWVHRGLLLGTGPIVDPEFNGHLLIPIHNFNHQPISLEYAQKIISVEFTKTLNPTDELRLKPDDDYFQYKKNSSKDFDINAYRKDIENLRIENSVSKKFDDFDNTIRNYNKTIENHNKTIEGYKRINIIGTIVMFIALITLVLTSWSLISSAFKQTKDANNVIKQYKSQNIDYRAFVLKNDFEKLQKKYSDVKKNQTTLTIRTNTANIEVKNKIAEMTKKIQELEKQIQTNPNQKNNE